MRRSSLLVPVLIVILAFPLAAGADRAAVSNAAVVKVAYNKKLKRKILVTANGMSLYLFTADTNGTSACSDDPQFHCSKLWPPYRSTDRPIAGKGVKAALLKTTQRDDGDPQVSYNGHPLYTEAGTGDYGLIADKKAGQTRGQGFMQIWWVVSPQGRPIKKK
jgi:predicted lipoprotein with Yx(FWY)xxD motif